MRARPGAKRGFEGVEVVAVDAGARARQRVQEDRVGVVHHVIEAPRPARGEGGERIEEIPRDRAVRIERQALGHGREPAEQAWHGDLHPAGADPSRGLAPFGEEHVGREVHARPVLFGGVAHDPDVEPAGHAPSPRNVRRVRSREKALR